METSIGYFGEEADYRLFEDLTSICSYSAKPYSTSPIFMIDTINRDYLIREFQPFALEDISEEYLELHMKRKFNLESSSMEEEWKFYERGNKGEKRKNEVSPDDAVDLRQILNLHLNLRLYSFHETIRLLKHAGWNCVSKYSDIATLEPFNRASRNMVLVSQRTSNYDARL